MNENLLSKKEKLLQKNFVRIVGIGNIEIELRLELSKDDCKKFNIQMNESFLEMKDKILKTDLKERLKIRYFSRLLDTLEYLNKSLTDKAFIEFIPLNSIEMQDFSQFKNQFIKALDDGFIFLSESGVMKINQIKIILEIENEELIYEEIFENSFENNDLKENSIKRLKSNIDSVNFLFIDIYSFSNEEELTSIYNDLLETILSHTNSLKKLKIVVLLGTILKNSSDDSFVSVILEIMNLADYIIVSKKDAKIFLNVLNYPNSNDANVENELINLKEFYLVKRGKEKCFLINDEFLKMKSITVDLSLINYGKVVSQVNTKKNIVSNFQIKSNKEFSFNLGMKIDFYKILKNNFSLLYSCFIGSFLSRKLFIKDETESFNFSLENFQKLFDLLYKKLPLPPSNSNYFAKRILVEKDNFPKIHLKQSSKEIDEKKEKNFVLDCVSLNRKAREYNPLVDNNLGNFFKSKKIRKHLENLELVSNDGRILSNKYKDKLKHHNENKNEMKLPNVVKTYDKIFCNELPSKIQVHKLNLLKNFERKNVK